MNMLTMRALLAACTMNTIGLYVWTENIAPFNIALAAWCFVEWMVMFGERGRRDTLDWVLPPLNQLCLFIRVFAQEIHKIT